MIRTGIRICVLSCLAMAGRTHAVSVTNDEMAMACAWLEAGFKDGQRPPFSFKYGDRASVELLKDWDRKHGERKLDDARSEHTLTYTDPQKRLVLRCVAV